MEIDLQQILEGCKKNDRRSQKELYKLFYSAAMGVCLRFTQNRDDAVMVMNDGFYKVFTKLDSYDPKYPFVAWLKRIMTNTAIDFYRSSLRFQTVELSSVEQEEVHWNLENLQYEDLMKMIESLSPAYRTVFLLHVVEGYSHEEIAEMLQISVGTSKSNLSKARSKLVEKTSPKLDDYEGIR
ncbi:RNA polymerase, sigma-24 subunit, ECF subfamily [Leadbetterella byssophila DSM 17132]|uniref:RNA polymerase, sigma-24 subunit, ECF subfamily n=1 Tax=Leadbetterella byssophila (strain DSM 17132 / JCM 16389 / KACC 11308 / NBRC 106382 / 4M15) TaxID=649349 RepID=E4RW27_LEAB4|nr:RNA polymerase sigma factor [Leadbetterella byssophila]ADQ16170.1 RNA polymerase, sigma-24 subunit, ECF subfamily [Leadbetterella byssophila DSM 17132]